MIIDCHTHIFPPAVRENRQRYIDSDPCFAELYSDPKAKLATAEELIASMDREQVAQSVVLNIGWRDNQICIETNDYLMESVARYPDRLIGFGMVPFHSSSESLKEIERCAGGGMKGIGEIRPDAGRQVTGDMTALTPLIESIIEHKMMILTHASEPVGHRYPGKGSITPEALYPLITGFPGLTLVCAHWGGGLPFYGLMPEVNKAFKNVFFDTAASPFLYRPQIYRQAVELVGADKILFGSDYPLMAPGRLLKEIKSLGLSAENEQQILSGNACRLLGIRPER